MQLIVKSRKLQKIDIAMIGNKRIEEVVTAVSNILNDYTTNLAHMTASAQPIAQIVYDMVMAAMQSHPEQRVIAVRYAAHPAETAALLQLELAHLLTNHHELTAKLEDLAARYETAVSATSTSTQINVSGRGTVVQGDSNTVVGAGATVIQNSNVQSSGVHLSANDPMPHAQELRRQLLDLFNESELRDLCWDLGIRYEELGGDRLGGKVRELLGYCWRNGRLPDLLAYCRREKGHVDWPAVE